MDERFERRAVEHIAHALPGCAWTDAEYAAAMAKARLVLARMRTLWANDPHLAPRTPSEHALRLVSRDPLTLFPDDPEGARVAGAVYVPRARHRRQLRTVDARPRARP